MSDSSVLVLEPAGATAEIDAEQISAAGPGGKPLRRERLEIGGAALAEIVRVLNAAPAGTEYALVVRPIPSVAAQPVSATSLPLPSGASTEATLALIKAKTDNLDVLLSSRTKPADVQGIRALTSADVVTVAASTNRIGSVRPVDSADADLTSAKGTQTGRAVGTQDLKDAGRTPVTLFLDAVAGITTEALGTMGITKGGVAQTAATSYTVTAGKTFRISGIHTSVKNTSTVASDSRVRVRQAASSISVASPIILLNEAGSPAAIAQAVGTDDTVMPDGYEVAGGQQVAISHVESAITCTVSVLVVGYEY